MIIVYYSAVGTDRHINTRLAGILVPRVRNVYNGRRLATADTLLFAGDADRTSADADLDEISSRLGEESEALGVDDILRYCSYLN